MSRHYTRQYLLQSLYAETLSGDTPLVDEPFFPTDQVIDRDYYDQLVKAIHDNEGLLFSIIGELAPKYDIRTIPIINAIILLIAMGEILILQQRDVPDRVALNEAIELAKRYSDDNGKKLINGVLDAVLHEKKTLIESLPTRKKSQYSLFLV